MPGATRRPKTKRRARAVSSETDNRPARAALAVEKPAPLRRTGRGDGTASDRPVDLFAADDTLAAAHAMNLDPRQRTLDGFELAADALESLRERLGASVAVGHELATEEPAGPEHVERAPVESAGLVHAPVAQELAAPEPVLARVASHQRPAKAGRDTATTPSPRVRKEPAPPVPGASAAVPAKGGRGGRAQAHGPARSLEMGAAAVSAVGADVLDSAHLTDARRLADEAPRDEPDAPAAPSHERSAGDTVNRAPSHRPTLPGRSPQRAASAGLSPDASAGDALMQTITALQAALADERRGARESRRLARRLVWIAMAILLVVLALGVTQTLVAMRVARESVTAQQKTEALFRAQQVELSAFIDAASGASADIRDAAGLLNAKLAEPSTHAATPQRAQRLAHPHRANERTRGSTAH
jgi:hypothetical protein